MVSNPDHDDPVNLPGADNSNRGFGNLWSKLSSRQVVELGKILGRVAYLLDVPHRRIVRRNLTFAYPDWTPHQIKNIARRVFQNLAISLLEFFQTASLSREQVLNQVQISGVENWHKAMESKNGLIIVSAHLGNWEMGLRFAGFYMQKPILGVAKKIRFAPLNRWVYRFRTRFGTKIIYKKGALPEMRRMLSQGGVVGLLVDQSRRSEGVEVQFFGHRVTTTPAAAFLAIRCKSPVLPIFCVRGPGGRLTIEVKPALEMKWTGDLRSDVQTNTQFITDTVEQAVRKYPEQWFWVHKRWKKYYPHLYPEYVARRKRRQKKRERQRSDASG
jgi:KDO2-lipid IV(A) lauroyltransferase